MWPAGDPHAVNRSEFYCQACCAHIQRKIAACQETAKPVHPPVALSEVLRCGSARDLEECEVMNTGDPVRADNAAIAVNVHRSVFVFDRGTRKTTPKLACDYSKSGHPVVAVGCLPTKMRAAVSNFAAHVDWHRSVSASGLGDLATKSSLAFDGFTAVAGNFNRTEQRKYTCRLDSPTLLEDLRQLPGAADILSYISKKYSGRTLLAADVLFQSPSSTGSTLFSTHRDNTAELADADITVVLKLSRGKSRMQVMGCSETEYPSCAGSFVAFRSGCLHRSIAADTGLYKLVLFYSATKRSESAGEHGCA
jgi:hypothetical protein